METVQRSSDGDIEGLLRQDQAAPAPPLVDSGALMQGGRELLIRHGANTYRLRVTLSDKLILTK